MRQPVFHAVAAGAIEELEELVQSVDLVDVLEDGVGEEEEPEEEETVLIPDEGTTLCQQCYGYMTEGRVDPSDGSWYCTACWQAYGMTSEDGGDGEGGQGEGGFIGMNLGGLFDEDDY